MIIIYVLTRFFTFLFAFCLPVLNDLSLYQNRSTEECVERRCQHHLCGPAVAPPRTAGQRAHRGPLAAARRADPAWLGRCSNEWPAATGELLLKKGGGWRTTKIHKGKKHANVFDGFWTQFEIRLFCGSSESPKLKNWQP